MLMPRIGLAAASLSVVALAGCDNERKAEADTPVSEAEVSTDLPETVISDERLDAAANAAAAVAATPPAEVIAVPVPAGQGQTQANRTTNGTTDVQSNATVNGANAR